MGDGVVLKIRFLIDSQNQCSILIGSRHSVLQVCAGVSGGGFSVLRPSGSVV